MPGDALTPAAPRAGWHGKLPCRGDFLGGGAQGRLIEGWRDWALTGLAMVRAGGEAARDAFLIAPVWRFAARSGVFGPVAGYGLIAPGADAGGRLFPVLAAVETPIADPDATLDAVGPWLDAAEAAILAALDPAAEPDALTAALDGAPPAPDCEIAGPDAAFAAGPAENADRAVAAGAASPALFNTLFRLPPPEAAA